MDNDILCLPSEAFLESTKPYSVILAMVDEEYFRMFYSWIVRDPYAYEGLSRTTHNLHFSVVPCSQNNKKSYARRKFLKTPCYCVKTKTWHLPYKGKCREVES